VVGGVYPTFAILVFELASRIGCPTQDHRFQDELSVGAGKGTSPPTAMVAFLVAGVCVPSPAMASADAVGEVLSVTRATFALFYSRKGGTTITAVVVVVVVVFSVCDVGSSSAVASR